MIMASFADGFIPFDTQCARSWTKKGISDDKIAVDKWCGEVVSYEEEEGKFVARG